MPVLWWPLFLSYLSSAVPLLGRCGSFIALFLPNHFLSAPLYQQEKDSLTSSRYAFTNGTQGYAFASESVENIPVTVQLPSRSYEEYRANATQNLQKLLSREARK
jgi:hypothetical protein